MIFGCHVSIKEGYLGAAKLAYKKGASAFQFFPKNPRSLVVKEFDHLDALGCKEFCEKYQLQSIIHTPYPTSLTPTVDKRNLTIQSIINDLSIADACGAIGVVVHFGSPIDTTNPLESYHLMIDMLNSVLEQWDGQALILLENIAGGSMGVTLEEHVQVRSLSLFPEKIGFCFDTCHAFASGLWNGENTKELLQKGTTLNYWSEVKAFHLNNSKYNTGSGKDRHANIFQNGFIKETEFDDLLTSPMFQHLPFILETPKDDGISYEEELVQLQQRWGGLKEH
ncbi:deoxyribonuclease IV [Robertmurraya korlensis]|uniref:deoxyribonuclease IV n=1 Tax=Robertmurraya korlensis TaxID=519977 RepID=UPI0008260FBE|nr:deoxyribonuclease IV [Robertmurraya korlensis]